MDELKPCPLCGWCDGKHLPTTVDNETHTTEAEPNREPMLVFVFNWSEYLRKRLYLKVNEMLNGGDTHG